MVSLDLSTLFWGEKHTEMFANVLIPSLCAPLNREALQKKNARLRVWCEEKNFSYVARIVQELGINLELNAADQFLEDLPTKYLNDSGIMMNKMFMISAKKSHAAGVPTLQVPVDSYFGGESIANIIQAGEQPGTVVFVIHLRVKPSIRIDLPTKGSVGNARLVSLAVTDKHAHKCFTEAEFGGERINTEVGGIFWKKRPSGIYAVQHFLPTPYLINWTKQDIDFFCRENPPGHWPPVYGESDHLWPGVCVYPQERARVLGSSDDAFIVELTDEGSNVPPLQHYDRSFPDKFWRDSVHNKVNKMFCVTLRGE